MDPELVNEQPQEETLGDLLVKAENAHNFLSSILEAEPHAQLDYLLYTTTPEDAQACKEFVLDSGSSNGLFSSTHFEQLPEGDRQVLESLIFQKPISGIEIIKEKHADEEGHHYSLGIRFEDGLQLSIRKALSIYDFIGYNISKDIQIDTPLFPPRIIGDYEVSARNVWTSFVVEEEMIPDEKYLAECAAEILENRATPEKDVNRAVCLKINSNFEHKAQKDLETKYKAIQEELLGSSGFPSHFRLNVEHRKEPKREDWPIVFGTSSFDYFVSRTSPPASLNIPVSRVVARFDEIGSAVNDLYQNPNFIPCLENFNTAVQFIE